MEQEPSATTRPLTSESKPSQDPESDLDPRRWIALGIVLIASFMVLLDISIVNVAIPSIQRNLHASFGQIQLVIALYQLAYAVVLITGGRLGDIYGRKRLFMLGMAGFVLASALCGMAQIPDVLVASRFLQGVMAALMYPQVLSVIQVSFPPRERGSAFAVLGATIGIATITGPLAGGLLIQGNIFGLDWRPIFLVNVPIGMAALIGAFFLLHESRSSRAPRLDPIGVVIVTIGLFLLVWPLVEGRDAGWPLWAYVSLVASVPVLVLFVLFERRQNERDNSPLLELGLFKDRAFVVGLLVTFLFLAGIPAFFLTFSLYIQIGLGFDALHAGLTTLPFSVGSFLASAASARLAGRLGRNILLLGSALITIGYGAVILTVHLVATSPGGIEFIPAFFICGLGLGSVIAPLLNVILAGISTGNAGSASGVLTTTQQVSGAVGVSLIGIIFFGLLGNHAGTVSREFAPSLQRQLLARHVPPAQTQGIVAGFARCFHDRSNQNDPTATPRSCPQSQRQTPVTTVIAGVAGQARARNFSDSFDLALLFNVAVAFTTFVLIFGLPRAGSRQTLQGEAVAG
ncbi:MAG: MFS transporter [Chloroflexota bacterium]